MEISSLTPPEAIPGRPEWVQDAVFYQIFPDRFAMSSRVTKPDNLEPWDSSPTSHGFKGGDLLGVAEHLDYLCDLGITAIYFTPVFRSTANHRYHTHDYSLVDPILGGNEALTTLLAEAHRRDVRVILDGVFNHASRGFYQFNSILENGKESPYLDWFRIYAWPLNPYGPDDKPAGYDAWWNLRDLPKFNTATPAVRDFLWQVGADWVERGIDGWRLDVPNEIDDDAFWREFRMRVKRANPEAYIVGEIWGDARRWLAGDQFDAVMNYVFTRACLGFFAGTGSGVDEELAGRSGLNRVAPLDARAFADEINTLLGMYPWDATLSQLNLLGSHDTPRYLSIAKGDESSLRLATLFQMTYPGAPCIYYGDEIGMMGGSDPDNRRAFPWQESRWNQGLRQYVKQCILLRRAHSVLRRGDYTCLEARDQVYVFERRLDEQIAVVALNASQTAQRLNLRTTSGDALVEMETAWGEQTPKLSDGEIRDWDVPSRSGMVLLGRVNG